MIIARPGRQLTVKFDQIMFAISPWRGVQRSSDISSNLGMQKYRVIFKADKIREKKLNQHFKVNVIDHKEIDTESFTHLTSATNIFLENRSADEIFTGFGFLGLVFILSLGLILAYILFHIIKIIFRFSLNFFIK